MNDEQFLKRLTYLRMKKGVTARDMSLGLGQNSGYINNIENGKAMPSMAAFFNICDYFDISPAEFFDYTLNSPWEHNELGEKIKRLRPEEAQSILVLVSSICALRNKGKK